MSSKSLLVATALALSPVAAFAAATTPMVPSPSAAATPDKTQTAMKPAHKAKHNVLVKKQHVNLKAHKAIKTPATKT